MDELGQFKMLRSLPLHCTPLRWMGTEASALSLEGILHKVIEIK